MKERNSKIISLKDALKTLSDVSAWEEQTGPDSLLQRVQKIEDLKETVNLDKIKQIFLVILAFLQENIQTSTTYAIEGKKLDDIHRIMVLVGDAVKKLDQYRSLFQLKSEESISQLAEYKRLQEFYTHRVERQIDVGMLGKWIMGLTGATPQIEERKMRMLKEEKSKHVFVDLDMVKKDSDYELLLMRKEDGSRFFSPRLLRNIRIVSDFGGYSQENKELMIDVDSWREKMCNKAASQILRSVQLTIHRFYQEAFRHKDKEAVSALNKAIMALFLASHKKERKENEKTAVDYFADFVFFLRECLHSRTYQKLILYPSKNPIPLASCILETAENLARGLMMHCNVMNELYPLVMEKLAHFEDLFPTTVAGEKERGAFLWSRIGYDFEEMVRALRLNSGGPLKRILETLEEGHQTAFDPIFQINLPYVQYSLGMDEEAVTVLRLPSPTRQTQINKAIVTDEFKAFLLSKDREGKKTKHLLVNLQDRTAWKEFARASCIEQLAQSTHFKDQLVVVTLAVDTPFYHQNGPYLNQDQADIFKEQFLSEMKDDSTGFLFPEEIKAKLFPTFARNIVDAVHDCFFQQEKFLPQKERQAFIALTYLMLTLKIIEICEPTTFSFTCKDGVDLSSIYFASLMAFVKLIENRDVSEEDVNYIKALVFGPAIFVRERAPLPDAITQLVFLLQAMERVKERQNYDRFIFQINKLLQPLYKTKIDHLKVTTPFVLWETEEKKAA